MKAISLPVIAVSLALAMPAFADDSHHPAQPGAAMQTTQALPDAKMMQQMQGNLATMQKQLEQYGKAKTAEERQKIMTEHMQTMQTNMGMMRGMQPGTGGCPMMQGGMDKMGHGTQGGMGMMNQGMGGDRDMMARRMDMMEKRMDMMQKMMQQGGMHMMQPGDTAKPAS